MKKNNFVLIILIIFSYNSFLFSQTPSDKEQKIKLGESKWTNIDNFETCYRWPIINKLYI